jgi:hypothetical protein
MYILILYFEKTISFTRFKITLNKSKPKNKLKHEKIMKSFKNIIHKFKFLMKNSFYTVDLEDTIHKKYHIFICELVGRLM